MDWMEKNTGPGEKAKKPLPNRQSIRMKGWDYSTPGWYFITCNTHDAQPLFGTIVNGQMVLRPAGKTAEACWQEIPRHFPGVLPDAFVVMPNHIHGVLQFVPGAAGGQLSARPTLGEVMGAYKSAVSRILRRGGQLSARAVLWHRNYWDVIVRDEKALVNIRRYIRENPRNFEHVLKCGEPKLLGNPELLKLRKVGFLASRGENESGILSLNPGEAILSGFLSPMERRVFRAGLATGKPMIWVKPWGLGESLPDTIHRAVTAGRLLILSPFDDSIEAPSAKRAIWCNEYVVAHSDRVVIGHLNPGGLLACILSEVPAEVEIEYL